MAAHEQEAWLQSASEAVVALSGCMPAAVVVVAKVVAKVVEACAPRAVVGGLVAWVVVVAATH